MTIQFINPLFFEIFLFNGYVLRCIKDVISNLVKGNGCQGQSLLSVGCTFSALDIQFTHNEKEREADIMGYVTGKTIKELREKRKITQKELAEKINVSDKTVSKWETGKGLPDVAIIEELARALGTSITELLTGDLRENENMSGNMKRMHFFVCPICGNIIASVGQGVFSCCGITLYGAEGEKCDEDHLLCVETVDNEYHVTLSHPMDKKHYISFIAYVTSDSYEIVKLYPEQDISVRFRKKGHGIMFAYCNRHGMFQKPV